MFPTLKYRLVRDRLLAEGTIAAAAIRRPEPATDAQVALVHTPAYLERVASGSLWPAEEQRLEVPFSVGLREGMWRCAGGSTLAARLALEHRIALHLGGGFHHAFADHGEGFCLINDVAIALRVVLREGAVARAAVIDLDVHHGNGTAAIFADDPAVYTCSFHQEHNYPHPKPPGDLDVGLADGTGDAEYLDLLDRHLPALLAAHRPDLAFYLAGADPYRFDQLGGLALSLDGLRHRDERVLDALLTAGVPVAVTLAGGYAIDPQDTVEIHCGTARAAADRI